MNLHGKLHNYVERSCIVLVHILILMVIILVLFMIAPLIGNIVTQRDLSCGRRSWWTVMLQEPCWKLIEVWTSCPISISTHTLWNKFVYLLQVFHRRRQWRRSLQSTLAQQRFPQQYQQWLQETNQVELCVESDRYQHTGLLNLHGDC